MSDLCSITNCAKPRLAFGYCKSHYRRFKLYGDPVGGRPLKGSGLKWLLDHIAHDGDECLIWPFARSNGKYGSLWIDGACVTVHRYMCELAHGLAPTPEHEAAHSCGNGLQGCTHPRHLSWKTRMENAADKVAHGTAPRGENCGKAVLTANDVRNIRALAGTMPQKEIATRYGIGSQAIGKIINGQRWQHV